MFLERIGRLRLPKNEMIPPHNFYSYLPVSWASIAGPPAIVWGRIWSLLTVTVWVLIITSPPTSRSPKKIWPKKIQSGSMTYILIFGNRTGRQHSFRNINRANTVKSHNLTCREKSDFLPLVMHTCKSTIDYQPTHKHIPCSFISFLHFDRIILVSFFLINSISIQIKVPYRLPPYRFL